MAVVLSSFAGFLNDLDVADAAQAKAMAERALSIEQRSGRAVQIAGALMQLGRAELGLQHLDSSDTHFRDAWRQASSVSHEAMLAHIGFRWGELAFAQGNTALALQRLEAARRAYETQGNRHRLAKVQQQLEKVYLASGDPLAAARAGREHYRLRDALLGGPAIARIGELLRQFEVDEERLRNAQLQREKAETELRLSAERRKFQNFSIAALMVASVLLLFGWRHFTVERLYRVLRERNRVVQEQAEQLRLANVQLTEQTELLYRSSITDALTGVANRRRGMQVLEASTAETAAGRPAFAVLVIDIDHFKQINDTLGHPVGDHALKSLADLLQHALPPAATLARMGGEEFMVILPDTALEAAHGIAEDLRQQAAAMSLRTDRGARSLTISIGVAVATPGRTSASARMLYASADAALYAAKRDGRNRVVIA